VPNADIGASIGGIPELIRAQETGTSFTSGDEASSIAALTDMTERSGAQIEDMGRCEELGGDGTLCPSVSGPNSRDLS